MPFWRRQKPLHEQLAEQGGMTMREHPAPIAPPFDVAGVHGLHRPREFDAVVTLEADAPGDELGFVALDDGTLLLESDVEVDLDPFADALQGSITPPYRAIAIRKGERTWAVAANGIEVAQLGEEITGDSVELAVQDGHRTLLVDGVRTFGSIPSLEELAGDRAAYVVRAERLEGELWEIRVAPL